ncbi:hypothetical protein V6N12_070279 [Hibiscus sabdariffa]|uniref:RNase H type-1 domain-containing protein n=1 Tax=Hibiscus sabdariffa TaxID=183260 RepID=A0ABR2FGC1_9ROSI
MSDIWAIIGGIKVFARLFASCRFTHIGRACNRTAHAIAAKGIHLQSDRMWMEDAHDFVLLLAAEDRRFQDLP